MVGDHCANRKPESVVARVIGIEQCRKARYASRLSPHEQVHLDLDHARVRVRHQNTAFGWLVDDHDLRINEHLLADRDLRCSIVGVHGPANDPTVLVEIWV